MPRVNVCIFKLNRTEPILTFEWIEKPFKRVCCRQKRTQVLLCYIPFYVTFFSLVRSLFSLRVTKLEWWEQTRINAFEKWDEKKKSSLQPLRKPGAHSQSHNFHFWHRWLCCPPFASVSIRVFISSTLSLNKIRRTYNGSAESFEDVTSISVNELTQHARTRKTFYLVSHSHLYSETLIFIHK